MGKNQTQETGSGCAAQRSSALHETSCATTGALTGCAAQRSPALHETSSATTGALASCATTEALASPEERKHAILGASSAYRWMNCTPSARAEDAVPDSSTVYSEEGTLAHALAAKALKEYLGLDTAEEDQEIEALREKYYCGEMQEHVDSYVAFVLDRWREARETTPDARLMIEQRLDYSAYVPEGFGTGDAVIVADGRMEIIDLKYGKGIRVEAEGNAQMRLYALGALKAFDYAYDIQEVRMTIYQPRLGSCSSSEMDCNELAIWGLDQVVPFAALAYQGLGHRAAGSWCRFCRAASDCRALISHNLAFTAYGEAETMTPEEIAEHVLPYLADLGTWVSSMKEYTLKAALEGTAFPGWKIVKGRSTRKIFDQTGASAVLIGEGLSAEEVFKPREIRTITELEKRVGKKRFGELLKDYISKTPDKPTLAPEEDKRQAMDPADDFNF